jgi:hypothetical protein
MRLPVTMLLLMLPLCAQSPAPPQKKGGGPPKNLKLLTVDDLKSGIMGKFVAALGVAESGNCNFCHTEGQDKASDDNPKKEIARKMITMVKEINAKFPQTEGKVWVTCYTCHRGKPEPETAPPAAGLPLP